MCANCPGPAVTRLALVRHEPWVPIISEEQPELAALEPADAVLEANKLCEQDYREDMCPKTLEILARTVYVAVKPDDTEEVLQDKITRLRAAMN